MQYQILKNTELKISCITLGTWVFGGQMWGGANKAHCREAVASALDRGVNCIDTAPIYGNGLSEEIVGEAISGKRDKIVLATKCGLVIEGSRIVHNLKPPSIAREIENSLRRLKTDYIDLYQLHWPDPATSLEETLAALDRLKEQGKIRYVGLSNHSVDDVRKACKVSAIVTTQNSYSLLDRAVEKELLPFSLNEGIGVLAYGPLAGGLLTGKYKEAPHFPKGDARSFFYKFYQEKTFAQVQCFLKELSGIGRPLNQLAINWVRQRAGVLSVLVGCRNAKQVEQNMAAADWDLTDDQIKQIEGTLNNFLNLSEGQ